MFRSEFDVPGAHHGEAHVDLYAAEDDDVVSIQIGEWPVLTQLWTTRAGAERLRDKLNVLLVSADD